MLSETQTLANTTARILAHRAPCAPAVSPWAWCVCVHLCSGASSPRGFPRVQLWGPNPLRLLHAARAVARSGRSSRVTRRVRALCTLAVALASMTAVAPVFARAQDSVVAAPPPNRADRRRRDVALALLDLRDTRGKRGRPRRMPITRRDQILVPFIRNSLRSDDFAWTTHRGLRAHMVWPLHRHRTLKRSGVLRP